MQRETWTRTCTKTQACMHEYKQWKQRIIENNNKATNLHLNKKTATVASRYAIKGLFPFFFISHWDLTSVWHMLELTWAWPRIDCVWQSTDWIFLFFFFSFLTTERAVITGRGDWIYGVVRGSALHWVVEERSTVSPWCGGVIGTETTQSCFHPVFLFPWGGGGGVGGVNYWIKLIRAISAGLLHLHSRKG